MYMYLNTHTPLALSDFFGGITLRHVGSLFGALYSLKLRRWQCKLMLQRLFKLRLCRVRRFQDASLLDFVWWIRCRAWLLCRTVGSRVRAISKSVLSVVNQLESTRW